MFFFPARSNLCTEVGRGPGMDGSEGSSDSAVRRSKRVDYYDKLEGPQASVPEAVLSRLAARSSLTPDSSKLILAAAIGCAYCLMLHSGRVLHRVARSEARDEIRVRERPADSSVVAGRRNPRDLVSPASVTPLLSVAPHTLRAASLASLSADGAAVAGDGGAARARQVLHLAQARRLPALVRQQDGDLQRGTEPALARGGDNGSGALCQRPKARAIPAAARPPARGEASVTGGAIRAESESGPANVE